MAYAKPHVAVQARRSLDSRFADMRPAERFTPPVRGWIKAIREALGMTTAQLARRLGVSQPTVSDLEHSEIKGTIQLATLRRLAEAMNCTLVYALVPKAPLETIVERQAHEVAARRLQSVAHTMRLENQRMRREDLEAQIDAVASTLKPNAI